MSFGSLLAWALATPCRRPPVRLGALIVVVGGAIAANALFLQPHPHPAPLLVTRETAEPAVPRADELVLAVQSALRRVGLYTGPLDGVAGRQTEAAILAFEAAAGRAKTGGASLDLLRAIREAKAHDATSLAELAASDPKPDDRVAAIQHALAISAYGPLRQDGILGPGTRTAIIRFQRDRGLPPTGDISDALIRELRATGALQDVPAPSY